MVEVIGEKKAREFAEMSYKKVGSYFRSLAEIQFTEDNHIKIFNKEISEKNVLAFSMWMQQFLKELKEFMIGLGRVEATQITAELREQLQSVGFYEYFEQAKKLDY